MGLLALAVTFGRKKHVLGFKLISGYGADILYYHLSKFRKQDDYCLAFLFYFLISLSPSQVPLFIFRISVDCVILHPPLKRAFECLCDIMNHLLTLECDVKGRLQNF